MTYHDPLAQAAFEGDVAKLARLLDAGVAIHAQDCAQPDALHAAIENDQVECVRLLLARGADPNRATSGFTALVHAVDLAIDASWQKHHAYGHESLETIMILLQSGADPAPAIEVARRYGNERMVSLLEDSPKRSYQAADVRLTLWRP